MKGARRLLIIGLLLSLPIEAFSDPPKGSVYLTSSQLKEISSGGKNYVCGNLPPWIPGRLVSEYFYPSKVELQVLTKKIKATRSTTKKAKLTKKRKSLKSYYSTAKPLCEGSTGGTPSPTGNFDTSGNLTATGKAAFQVPSYISNAGALAGITKWNSSCKGCHGTSVSALSLKTFPQILSRVQQSPMFFSVPGEVSEQNIADITAATNY